MKYRENGDFVSGLYETSRYNRERKTIEFVRNGNIITKKNKFGVKMKKTYSFKRNTIIVDYELTNNSDSVLNTVFGSEINLAMSSPKGRRVETVLIKKDKKIKPSEDMFTEDGISEVAVTDLGRKINLIISSDLDSGIWGFPVGTHTGTGKVVENLYQFDCFVPRWSISLGPGKCWKNRLQLRIERSGKKSD